VAVSDIRNFLDLAVLLFVVVLLVLVGATVFKKSLRPRRFKSDLDEIWQELLFKSIPIEPSTDGFGVLI